MLTSVYQDKVPMSMPEFADLHGLLLRASLVRSGVEIGWASAVPPCPVVSVRIVSARKNARMNAWKDARIDARYTRKNVWIYMQESMSK